MVYIIKEENFSITQKIIKRIMKEKEANFEELDILEFDKKLSPLYMLAKARTFFVQEKYILLRNSSFLGNSRKISKTQWEELKEFVDFASKQENIHVFLQNSSLNEKDKEVKELIKFSSVKEMKKYEKKDIQNLIKKFLEKKQIPVNSSLIFEISDRCLYDADIVENELKKISIYETKDVKEVLKIVTDYRKGNIWNFIDSFFKRDFNNALSIYKQLLEEGNNEITLLNIISRELDLMLKVQYELKNGFASYEIASKLNINPYRYTKLREKMVYLDLDKIEDLVIELFDVDKNIKYGSLNPETQFRQFLLSKIIN